MSNYGTMQSRIADELMRTDLTEQIKRAIQSAIKHYERERFWFNETSATAETVAGESGLKLAVPGSAVEFDQMTVTFGGVPEKLERVAWSDFVRYGATDTSHQGVPCAWTYYRDQFYFHPTPDDAYTLTLYYVETLSTLTDPDDTNAWMTDGEEMIRGRAGAEVQIRYLKDPEAIAEQRMFAARGEPYLSSFEKAAHMSLRRLTAKRRSSGKLRSEIPVILDQRTFDIRRGY